MTIQTIVQSQIIDGIGSIVMTDITQDPDTNNFIREIRVFDTTTKLIYTLRVIATIQTAIELTAPPQQF